MRGEAWKAPEVRAHALEEIVQRETDRARVSELVAHELLQGRARARREGLEHEVRRRAFTQRDDL